MKYNGEILNSGIGSKDRRAALVGAMTDAVRKAHGNSETGKALASILADAEARLAERLARKAAKVADDKPADKPAKVRKARKAKKAAAEPQPQPSAAPSREERAAAMKAAGDAWRAKRGKAD